MRQLSKTETGGLKWANGEQPLPYEEVRLFELCHFLDQDMNEKVFIHGSFSMSHFNLGWELALRLGPEKTKLLFWKIMKQGGLHTICRTTK